MALLFLLPILMCGFFYQKIHKKYKHSFQKLEGQQLYFRSALYGLIFTSLGLFVYTLLNQVPFLVDLSNYIKGSIFKSIFSVDAAQINLSSNNIKSVEQYKGLTTLNFYYMLTITTFLSLILIFLCIHISFIIKVIYEWIKQWVLYAYQTLIIRVVAWMSTLLKTLIYINEIFVESLISVFWGAVIHDTVSSSKAPKSKQSKQTPPPQSPQSFSKLWKSWNHGLVSISSEIKDPLHQLLYKSIHSHQSNGLTEENIKTEETKVVMLTMNDRKVYIGIVIGFGFDEDAFSVKNDTFRFLPMQSGFRDKYSLKVSITTDYIKTIENLKDLKEVEIILRKENIISATQFNAERFEKFREKV